MPSGVVLIICAGIGLGYIAFQPVKKAVNKASRGIVHVITLGKK
jgi:hypothetical protein